MAKPQSSTPPFFNFLKEGLLLPSRNRRLFVAVFFLVVVSTTSLHFLARNVLPIQPVVTDNNIIPEAQNSTSMTILPEAQNSTDDDPTRSSEFHVDDTSWDLIPAMIGRAGYHLITVIGDSLIRLIVLFAAVTTYSGELHTFAELLSEARTQLKGPLLTRAFLYALGIVAYVGVLAAMLAVLAVLMSALIFFPTLVHYTSFFYVASYVLVTASFFLHYCFSFLCWFSVVVAVAEPAGCVAGAAFGRVWRLMKGKKMRALLLISVTAVLPFLISLAVHTLPAKSSKTAASGLLCLNAIMAAAVEVLTVCAMTAFYYECTGSTSTEASAATGYICHGV